MNGTEKAIFGALATSTEPALATLEMPRYLRELHVQIVDNAMVFQLDKRGYSRYKRRCPYPHAEPPPADTEGIKTALNHMLPQPFKVKSIIDEGRYISIIMEELQ